MLRLQEKGILKELKKKWWQVGEPCPGPGPGGSAQMDLGKLGGVFIVVILGMVGTCRPACHHVSPLQVLACIIGIFEFAFLRRKLAVDENVSACLLACPQPVLGSPCTVL